MEGVDHSVSSPWTALSASFFLAFVYVGSLYVWRSDLDRNHPETIKRRFLSAFCTLWISPPIAYLFTHSKFSSTFGFLQLLGFRTAGLLPSLVLPLVLAMILFLGPLVMLITTGRLKWFFRVTYWRESLIDLVWWRNHVVAPFTEEFVFRACMLPILLGYFSPQGAIVISPLFFGIAHFHHMFERVRQGMDLKTAFLLSVFQFTYTTVFGIFSAFLFVRTCQFWSCAIVHGFCNFMGFPDLVELSHQEPKRRIILSIFFLLGVAGFFFTMFPLTDPYLYKNNVYSW